MREFRSKDHARRWTLRAFGFSLVLLLALDGGMTGPARAQASVAVVDVSDRLTLLRSDPVDGGRMSPRLWVKLEFSGPVDADVVSVQVRDDVGGQLEMGRPQVAGSTVLQKIFPGVSSGYYSISYSAAGEGMTPVVGSVRFEVVGRPGVPTRLKKKPEPEETGEQRSRKQERKSAEPERKPSPSPLPVGSRAPAPVVAEKSSGTPWLSISVGAALLVLAVGAGLFVRSRRRREAR